MRRRGHRWWAPGRRKSRVRCRCRRLPVPTLRGFGADLGISADPVRQLARQALETLHAAATRALTSS